MKKIKLPTIIALILLIAGVGAGVFLVQNQKIFRLGAEQESSPKDVRITNVTDLGFSVSWTTDKDTVSFLSWGESQNDITKVETDELNSPGTAHYVTVRGLSENKTYYFRIKVGETEYDNNGSPWSVKTGPALPPPDTSENISGTVLSSTGVAASNVIVHVNVGGASQVSTTTSAGGSWVVPLSSIRTSDLSQYFGVSPTDVIEIFAQGGSQGIASAQIYSTSAKPVPPIILGETKDFKNLPPSQTSELPQAQIDLPSEASQSSKFEVPDSISEATPSAVTLESLDEGEVVTSTTPEFFGEAPPNTEITIKIESTNPITESVTTDRFGDWNWSPPEDLAPGSHTITLSWKDENGLLRTLKKTFIVSAAEGPAFEATPSGSPRGSATPRSSPTGSPSSTSTASPSGTAFPQPDSGIGLPTLLMIFAGIGLVLFGGLVYLSI